MARGNEMRFVIATAMLCIGFGQWCEAAETAETAEASPVRLVHRFLGVEISPNGELVASVEGDSSASGGAPTGRGLLIRQVSGGTPITGPIPLGRGPGWLPGSPPWMSVGQRLSFGAPTTCSA